MLSNGLRDTAGTCLVQQDHQRISTLMCNRQFCSQNIKCVMNFVEKEIRLISWCTSYLEYLIILPTGSAPVVEQIDSSSF